MDKKQKSKAMWRILNGGLTLPEMFKELGKKEVFINETMDLIKKLDKHDSTEYTLFCFTLRSMAYKWLYINNEIDKTFVYNLANNIEPIFGDIGLLGDKILYYTGTKWIQRANDYN